MEQAVKELTKKLMDAGLIIEVGWQGFQSTCIPKDASTHQRIDMRNAFFAGAVHLYASIMTGLEGGTEPTSKDMNRMQNIHDEITEFSEKLKELKARIGR
jgi:hypothetical protein